MKLEKVLTNLRKTKEKLQKLFILFSKKNMHTNEASVFCFWKKSSDLQHTNAHMEKVLNDDVNLKDVSCDSSI